MNSSCKRICCWWSVRARQHWGPLAVWFIDVCCARASLAQCASIKWWLKWVPKFGGVKADFAATRLFLYAHRILKANCNNQRQSTFLKAIFRARYLLLQCSIWLISGVKTWYMCTQKKNIRSLKCRHCRHMREAGRGKKEMPLFFLHVISLRPQRWFFRPQLFFSFSLAAVLLKMSFTS